MSRPNLLPRTAPFGDGERASLDAVLGTASPTQRAWLAGFLAGLDAAGGQPAAVPAAPPKAAAPLTVIYASESGNSEALAGNVAKLARKQGFKPKVVDFSDLDVATLPKAGKLIAIAATWGEGEPPARAVRAYGELMGEGAPRLDGVEFAVLSLGDTSYAEFCAIGKALDARFEALGAKRAAERADLDLDFEKPAADWIKGALKALAPAEQPDNVVAVDFARAGAGEDDEAEPSREPLVVEVVEHVNLNSSRSDKETIHLALAFEDGAPAYEPGDSLEIFPENDPQLVDEILNAAGLAGDEALRRALLAERDITTLSAATIERFVKATGHADAQTLIDSGEAKAWIEGRHLIDLLETYPAKLTAEHIGTITRPLPPRAYSIASSRKEVGDEVHLAIAAVRYETHGRARSGVASVHVADRIRDGAKLRVRLKPNRHFRLPQDPATDIIMVGPGTGVAPFRAFVQERRAVEAPGRSWLFFGDRHFTHDFLYQLEWQDALEDGSLTKIDVAFSRDQPEKVYVQDRITQHAQELVSWLDGGAHLYVCGDAKNMAKDVRAAVVKAYETAKSLSAADAEAQVAALERSHRYQQDVY
ncbi:sulfite reductase (NADPH) flavoprotein alpha-component [Methylobacterium sp. PvP062]|uniref:Sulfite reductase [NADPH] flavoprotein alpha-component n=2 Tax=Methylobacterium TaxID=407 RepID=A0ABV2NR73_9HYPH|nr:MULTISPECIES: flavodoxin domain-containing protein [Methylobacterium]MCX7331530.1 flavodoxin domain-containing protein [Hyphomicrobiales bacterium]MBP2494359.1 sulfite reductase (NADPH) flavoprotein alpha-component [Methylobacterium sp. PvP105]MBP2499267.1 sulfite reductase (NADPH) flavoprotein alpha-component [Methylobacterium sp. PvP109]MDE3749284.1 flavodoxin domain-containing protein [Methylobacterium radiotolerans]PVZ06644.1 sulfite reductase (NADPH) flavoprotein alpha-component [Methy